MDGCDLYCVQHASWSTCLHRSVVKVPACRSMDVIGATQMGQSSLALPLHTAVCR